MLWPLNVTLQSVHFVESEQKCRCMNDSAGKLCPDIMLPRAIVSVQTETEGCIGYLGYPFQNKQGKSFVENLARSVEK